jgi:hypothetical protein
MQSQQDVASFIPPTHIDHRLYKSKLPMDYSEYGNGSRENTQGWEQAEANRKLRCALYPATMLVGTYPDLSDILDTDLFNLDSAGYDYLDSFALNDFSTPLPVPYSPPSQFIDNVISPTHGIGIDPQLVDTPSAVTDHGDEDDSELEDPPATSTKPTIIIPPPSSSSSSAKSTTHKSRKGTVLSGGIVKKSFTSKEKENTSLALVTSGVAAAKKTAASRHVKNPSLSSSSSSSPFGLPTITEAANSSFSPPVTVRKTASSDDGDEDDHEFPQDWRPSPEVLAKMTSKEKRQLRNKISARNFRIRRKGT